MALRLAATAAVFTLIAACGNPPAASGPSTTSAPVSPTSVNTASSPSASVPEQLRFSAKTVDGSTFNGADLAGKPVVLWFWAPWCPKCQREAPGMAAAAKDLGGRVTFLGVAALDEVPAMQQFANRYGLTSFQHVADTDSAVWKRFGVTAQPAYAFVDSAGGVDVVTRQLSEQDLRQRLNQLT